MRRCLLPLILIATSCASRPPLPYMGEVPQFRLTDQSGNNFTRSMLDGHVWVADFIYTTCPGPCPRMTSNMRAIQNATGKPIQLVSFTVDPENDTAQVLAAYAGKFGADASRWSFLTGEKSQLNALSRDTFKLSAGLDHSTRFVLVDRRSRIRAYYATADGNPVGKIVADAASLERERD